MKAHKNPLEWTVFGLSAVIFGALIIYLGYNAVRRPSTPPQIEVTTGAAERQGDWWAIPLTVANQGQETAENVRIEIVLQQEGEDAEVTEVTVGFLPRQSQRRAVALFRSDPRGKAVEARAVTFEKP